MTMPLNLVLVRHGQSEGNVAVKASRKGDDSHMLKPEFRKRHSSWWRLTDKGINEAKTTGQWLKENNLDKFDRYYASAYTRALETAAYLDLSQANWFVEPRLRERERGKEDLLSSDERKLLKDSAREKETTPLYWRPLNGESIADCCTRVRDLIETLHREMDNKQVIIVCHGEVMESFQIVIERWTHQQYKKYVNSSDPKLRINNGQIIQYSRQNPNDESDIRPYLKFKRSICPTDLNLRYPKWSNVEIPSFSNKDLLAMVEETPRIVNN